ncbi:MAG TPA: Holliday junction resolvase RuvX [Vicinamibacterales bacterium]|nr:Holliday junction resolvase RuvX [Vicinamibacterales bacterium]
MGRIIAFDVGRRRIGVAISDASGLLARPVGALQVRGLGAAAVDAAAEQVAKFSTEDDAVSMIVIGLPRRLDGTPNDMTAPVEQFAGALQARTGLPVRFQDERLSSREAESRLARREKDWRVRKQQLDAESAAIILQDYLDAGRVTPRVEF